MNFIKILAVSLFSLFLCSCGSSSDGTGSISTKKSVAYNYVTPGIALPELYYYESVSISGTAMVVTRNGGAQVNSGTWTFDLKQEEVTEINKLLSLADNPSVIDNVTDNTLYDGPYSELMIGVSKTFRYGMAIDPISNINQLHQFPIEAVNLVSYIESLVMTYAGNIYK